MSGSLLNASVETMALYLDLDTNALLSPGDSLISLLVFGGGGNYGVSGLSVPIGNAAGESFVVGFAFADTALTRETFDVRIGANQLVLDVAGSGPSPALLQVGIWSVSLPDTSGPNIWYVNNASTVGDSFTTAVGDTLNSGLFPHEPKPLLNTLEGLLSAGDTIYLDAGTFIEPDTFTISVDGVFLIGRDSVAAIIDFNNPAQGAARGVYASGRTGLRFSDFRVTKGNHGIWLSGGSGATVERVRSDSHAQSGFLLENGHTGSTLRNNTASGNTFDGFTLRTGSSGNTLTLSAANGNTLDGIYLNLADNNTIVSNTVTGNQLNGIAVDSSNGNILSSNTSSGNTQKGIQLDSSANNVLTANVSRSNGTVGFYLFTFANNNRLVSNTSTQNGMDAFAFEGVDNVLYQNTVESSSAWAFSLDNFYDEARFDTFRKNNIVPSANPLFRDSGVINNTLNKFDFTRNWWGTTDSQEIRNRIRGAGADSIIYLPFRLGLVDTTPGADTIAPKAPDTVAATALGSSSIKVSWAVSTTQEEVTGAPLNLNGYRVYRSPTSETSLWIQRGQVAAGVENFTDSGLTASTTYFYRVTAFDNASPFANEGFYSDSIVSATTTVDTTGPNIWYVNDGSTVGDSFTTAVGNAGNDGLSPSTPKRFLSNIEGLLTAGDTVFLDAGTYIEPDTFTIGVNSVFLTGKDSSSSIVDFNNMAVGAARGIYANSKVNLTIQDIAVIRGLRGIWFENVDSSAIRRVRSDTHSYQGISFDTGAGSGCDYNTVANNSCAGSTQGIYVLWTTNTTFSGNLLTNNGNTGFRLYNSISNVVTNNRSQNNTGEGFWFQSSSDNNSVSGNVSQVNTLNGYLFDGSSGNLVTGNSSINNANAGFKASFSGNNNRFEGNISRSNGIGFEFNGSSNNAAAQNTIDSTSGWAVFLTAGATLDTFAKNVILTGSLFDSGVLNSTSNHFAMTRNWWNTRDSSSILTKISNTSGGTVAYIPFRLGIVDTAPGADTVAPKAPDTVAAVAIDTSRITISWAAVTTNEEPAGPVQLSGYKIYHATSADTSLWIFRGTTSWAFTSLTDSGLLPSTTYFYRVTAYDIASPFPNESFYSDSIATATTSVDTFGPNIWYINDASTVGDSFTTAIGADSNSGLSPGSPRLTLKSVIPHLTTGDTIFVDKGTYSESFTITADSVAIIGKDSSAVGTVFNLGNPSDLNNVIRDSGANRTGLLFRNFRLTNAAGILLDSTTNSRIERVYLANAGSIGIQLTGGSNNNVIENCTVDSAQYGIFLYTGSHSNLVVNNRVTNATSYAYLIHGSTRKNRIVGNSSTFNSCDGFTLLSNQNPGDGENLFLGNTSSNNTGHGFQIDNSRYDTLVQNTFIGNTGWAVNITSSGVGPTLHKNNILQDSAIKNEGTGQPLVIATRNAFGTDSNALDSAVIKTRMGGSAADSIVYVPYRLGLVDTAIGADTIAPDAPETVAVQANGIGTLLVSWATPAVNEEPSLSAFSIQHFRVYRAKSPDTTLWVHAKTFGSSVTSFNDTTVIAGDTYYYRVTSGDAPGGARPNESFYSDSIPFAVVPSYNGPVWHVNDSDTSGDAFTSKTGSDTAGNGTESAPFRTFAKALVSASAGHTIKIDAGTYAESVSISATNLSVTGVDSNVSIISTGDSSNSLNTAITVAGDSLDIHNLKITNSYQAVVLNAATNTQIWNIRAVNNYYHGIHVSNSSDSFEVLNVTSSLNGGHGIFIENSDLGSVERSFVQSPSSDGIRLDTSSNNEILDNTIGGAGSFGIHLSGASDSNFIEANLSEQNVKGIVLGGGSQFNSIFSNEFTSNSSLGVYLSGFSNGNVFRSNLISENSTDGVHISSASNNLFVQNQISDNTKYQVRIDGTALTDSFAKNNFKASTTNPDSMVIKENLSLFDFKRNWWSTTDSSVIKARRFGSQADTQIVYYPFRLDIVDTTFGADTLAPALPAGLAFDTTSNLSQVTITWTAPTQDEEQSGLTGLIGYEVYRSLTYDTNDWSVYRINEDFDTTYVDTTVSRGTTYYYRITSHEHNTDPPGPNESFFGPIFEVKTAPDTIGIAPVASSQKTIDHQGPDETGVLAFRITSSSPDSITQIRVKFTGKLHSDTHFNFVRLYQDVDQDGEYDPGGDTFVLTLNYDSATATFSGSPNVTINAAPDSRWYVVTVRIDDTTALFADTFKAEIPIFGISAAAADSVPVGAEISGATHLVQSDSVWITLTPTSSKTVPVIGETAVAAFRIEASGPDSVTAIRLVFDGNLGDTGDFDLVRIYEDLNQNGEFDSGVDSFLQTLAFDSGLVGWVTAAGTGLAINTAGDSLWIVATVDPFNGAPGSDTFRARINPAGISAARGGTTPPGPFLFNAIITIEPYNGPLWYVNDGSQVGDVFTSAIGSDTAGSGSAALPFRTIGKALQNASMGETIIIDAGTYIDSVAIDTDLLTIRGADSTLTIINRANGLPGNNVIYATSRDRLTIRDLKVTGGWNGIDFNGVDNSLVERVHIFNNANHGISMSPITTTDTFRNNLVDSNGGAGISVGGGSGTLIERNWLRNNAGNGVELTGGGSHRVQLNTVSGNSQNGISIAVSSNAVIGNNVVGNAGFGIQLASADSNIVEQNQIQNNSSYQLRIGMFSSGNTITKNNLLPSGTEPDSAVRIDTTAAIPIARNWFGTTDTNIIQFRIAGAGEAAAIYSPFRLGIVDTALGADTVAPDAPDTVAATPIGDTMIRVTWSPVSTNEEPSGGAVNFGFYQVYRALQGDTPNWEYITNTATTSYVDQGRTVGVPYFYRITSRDLEVIPNESYYSDSIATGTTFLPSLTVDVHNSVPSSGNIVPVGADQTNIAVIRVTGAATDTLTRFFVNLKGNAGAAAAVDSVSIWKDANGNATLENGIDILKAVLPFVAGDTYGSDSLSISLPVGGEDTFLVVVTLRDTATPGDTVYALVSPGNLKTTNRDSGPLAADTAPGTFTVIQNPTNVSVHPTLPAAASINPAGSEKTGVLALSVGSDSNDTLTNFTVTFVGAAGDSATIWSVVLYRDANQNSVFDDGLDTLTDTLVATGANFALSGPIPLGADGAESFLVVVSLRDTATVGDTLRARIPANGIQALLRAAAPASITNGANVYQIANPADTSVVVAVNPSTPSETIAPIGVDLTRIMAFTVYGDTSGVGDTLTKIGVRLNGNGGNVAYIDYVSLYTDVNANGNLDTAAGDALVTNLGFAGYNQTYIRTSGLAHPLGADGIDSFLLVVSMKDSAPSGDSILAEILADSVLTSRRDSGPNLGVFSSGIFTIYDLIPPTPFSLTAPASNHETSSTSVGLAWASTSDAGSGMSHYRVQIATDTAFGSIVIDTTTALATTYTAALAGEGTRHWRVQALDVNGNVRFSTETNSFRIDLTPPSKPALLSPAESHDTTSATPGFVWAASTDTLSGLRRYRFQLASDTLFASITVDSTVGAALSAIRTLNSGVQYWRIVAEDSAGNSTASDSRTITVAGSGPSAPLLLSPANGHETLTLTPGFGWSASTDSVGTITSYRIQVDATGLFSTLVADSHAGLELTGDTTFLAAGTYHWRVRVQNSLGQAAFSSSREFTIDTGVAITLNSPAYGTSTSDSRPTFLWTSDGDTFRFEIMADSAGATLVESSTITASSFQVAHLLQGAPTTYFWRVHALDAAGNSDTSAFRQLIVDTSPGTDSSPPLTFDLVSPAHATCTNAASITLRWNLTTDTPSGIANYRVQVSPEPFDTMTLIYDSYVSASTDTFVVNLIGTRVYRWRVIANDNANPVLSRNSNSINAIVFDTQPPNAPSPKLNPSAMTETSSTTISFSVTAVSDTVSGIARYRFQLDTAGTFVAPFFDVTSQTASRSIDSIAAGIWSWRAAAVDSAGNQSSWTTTDTFLVATLAPNIPTAVFPAGDTFIGSGTVSFDWTDVTADSSALQRYHLRVSQDSTFATVAHDTQTADTTSALTLTGLGAGRWYWIVRSENQAGLVSDSSTLASFRIDAQTPPTPIVTAPTANAKTGTSTVSFTWTASGSQPTSGISGYNLVILTSLGAPFADSTFASTATTHSATVRDHGETSYSARVRAISGAGLAGSFSETVTFTIDVTPPNAAPTGISPVNGANTTTTSVVFQVAGGSDSGSGVAKYQLEISKDSFATTIGTVQTSDSAMTFTPLFLFSDTNTIYYWRVRAVDAVGLVGPASPTCSFVKPAPPDTTPPVPVSDLSATANNALGIQLQWRGSPSSDMSGGQYNIYWNLGIDTAQPSTLLKILAHTGAESYSYEVSNETALVDSRAYRFNVRAQDASGNEEANMAVVGATARSAAANITYGVIFNPESGRKVLRNGGVQVMAELISSGFRNLAETVVFQYRRSNGGSWTQMSPSLNAASVNPIRIMADSRLVYGMHWRADSDAVLADTFYDIRALVIDNAGNTSFKFSTPNTIELRTAASDADLMTGGGRDTASLEQKVDSRREEEIDILLGVYNQTTGETETLRSGITVPRNAMDTTSTDTSNERVKLRMTNTRDTSSANAEDLAEIGAAIGSDTAVGAIITVRLPARLRAGQTARITVAYPELDSSGLIPGIGLAPDSLVLRAADGTNDIRTWSYDSATNTPSLTHFSIDRTNRAITALVNRFSSFVLIAPTNPLSGPGNQAGLGSFMVYPNPYRPNDGNAATGRPFDAANDRTTGIVFDNLPARVKIEVYTLRGERIFEETVNVSRGYVTWNAKNKETGRDVASGFYIYMVTDLSTGQKVSGKLAVIR